MKMNYLLMPWELELDIDATEVLYETNNYATDQRANDEFISKLSAEQKEFFESLGVSLEKIKVEKKTYDIPADGEMPALKMHSMAVDFSLCGKFLAVPSFQKELYSDEEIFGKEFPEHIKVYGSAEEILSYDIGIGAGIVFKHPKMRLEDEKFQKWDCGYILGSLLIVTEEK